VEARNQLTVNLEVLVAVPPGVATLIFPVEAPDGTLTVTLVEASLVPTGPEVGVNEEPL
jgi:hypothetical protein